MIVRELRRRLGDVPRHVQALLVVLTAVWIASLVTHGTTRFVLVNVVFIGYVALLAYRWLTPRGRGTSSKSR